MRVLIFGHREWGREGPISALVSGLYAAYGPEITFIQGGAPGADSIAKKYADLLAEQDERVESLTFLAKWTQHDREGRTSVPCRCAESEPRCNAAGPRRNQQMLDEGKPQVGFGFHDYIKNARGTRDMADRLEAAGIPAYITARYNQAARNIPIF